MKFKKNKNRISVVIASLGSKKLIETIKYLENSTLKPSEIIICLPVSKKKKITGKKINIRTIYSNKFSQTHQRIEAINSAKYNIILQMDDDLILDKNCIREMYKSLIKQGEKNVFGSILYDSNINEYFFRYKYQAVYQFFREIYHTHICLSPKGIKKMGSLSKLGINHGVDPRYVKGNRKIYKCDWLNSFVMGYREDLKHQIRYPFSGKSYGEDIMNSILRKKNKINHFICMNSQYTIRKENLKYSIFTKIKNFLNIIRSQYYILNLIKGNKKRFFIYIIFFCLRTVLSKITKNFK